jgi:thioredoxin 1
MVKKLDKKGFEEALRADGIPVVINFTTTWCPYCVRLAPVFEKLADEYKDEINAYSLDTDEEEEISEQYDVMTVPTVFVFMNGEVKGSIVNPGSKEAIAKLIFS